MKRIIQNLVALTCMTAAAFGVQPNIVLIFADDLGYSDIGPFGATRPTPHFDRMADEGAKLTDFYVASVKCTPSRAALMTGCYANRVGMGGAVVQVGDERGLNPDETTMADMLKAFGYATGCFGKWHLGDQPQFMPLNQGFDEYEGIPYSNDMWNDYPLPWMKQQSAVAYVADEDDQAVLTDCISDATIAFIENHKDGPFFAYVPLSLVHNPQYATQERIDAAGGDRFTALMTEMDNLIGRIMTTLETNGIATNTLVFFTNDNGGTSFTSSDPLRGAKFGPPYEANMRVSTLAWWPGTIPAGLVVNEIGRSVDLLPTFANLAGGEVPTDRIIDGKDISDLLLVPGAASPITNFFYGGKGLRQDNWKLVSSGDSGGAELYDLSTDIGETNNLASLYTNRVADMTALLDAHNIEILKNKRDPGFEASPSPILDWGDTNALPTLLEVYEASLTYYSIDAGAGSNGSIDPSGVLSIPEGGGQSFTITADSGYVIQNVQVDGASVGAVSSYSFTDVTTNHTLTASFVKIPVAGDPVPVSITNEMGDFSQQFFRIIEE